MHDGRASSLLSIASLISATLKKRQFRSAAMIQFCATRTPLSTLALSRGLPGRAGITAVW
ncbi:MAG: hypothetical protein KC609_08275 [Myxococcales bacterium]|nr:hypothetical protein [Myxococcales bacterium]